MPTEPLDLTRLTNVELVETATAALAEYVYRTGIVVPPSIFRYLKSEASDLRQQFRRAVEIARATR